MNNLLYLIRDGTSEKKTWISMLPYPDLLFMPHKLDITIKYTWDIQKRANNSKEKECNALQHHIILSVRLCGWLFEQGGNGSSSLCNVN